jgi:predicted TIM-barrel fold metal-dependent hydrolase
VYARFVRQTKVTASRAEYKALQDFLFRYIAREAGRLGLAVHIHSFEGAGGSYRAAGSDPLLLEPVFNDPALRKTNFVILHGGGIYASHAGAMLWKPNVFVDMSIMPLIYPTDKVAAILYDWLSQYPDHVLFGSDAFANGPDAGWELAAWASSNAARHALGLALTRLMRSGDIDHARAEAIATMVLRTNANTLYDLKLLPE